MDIVLILGSGPNVLTCRNWPRAPFDSIVAINNAWKVRTDWDYLVHPDDFDYSRRPALVSSNQTIITSAEYVPSQNSLGGFVYAGGTMAFTASYWALATLKPKVIAMFGCDMVYPASADTHFYGQGTADPLRNDISLRSLEAKSARLMAIAAERDCAMVNLSADQSRLLFPRATPQTVSSVQPRRLNATTVAKALAEEQRLDYYVPSGKYWKEEDRFDPAAIDALDSLWLRSIHSA